MSMDISNIFMQLKKTCQNFSQDIEMGQTANLIAMRILVARLGDSENNSWWDTSLLSSFARAHLTEFLPRVLGSKRLIYAFATCAKAERTLIPDKNIVSLFNLTPDLENKIIMELSIERNQIEIDVILKLMEALKNKLIKTGWTSLIGFNISKEFTEPNLKENKSSNKLGTISEDLQPEKISSLIDSLISAYGYSYNNHLVVPYYDVIHQN